jgi:lipoprotein-releasing system ATP-binding protein
MSRDAVLRAEGLAKDYANGPNATSVLKGVGMEVQGGELVAVVGPSGAGKTTLLYLLGGLARPSAGEVWLAGEPLFELRDEALSKLRNRRLGFIFQYHHLLPDLDATANVALPMRVAGMDHRKALEKAAGMLQGMGLSHRLHHKPGELSGGEQQRVAVARALANQPQVLLADEPTGNLDKVNSMAVFDLLKKAAHEGGQAVVMVTHNSELARKADRVVRMEDGQILG